MQMSEIYKSLCEYVKQHGSVTVPVVQREFGVDFITARRLVAKLEYDGYVKFDGKLDYVASSKGMSQRVVEAKVKLRAESKVDKLLGKIACDFVAQGTITVIEVQRKYSLGLFRTTDMLSMLQEIGVIEQKDSIRYRFLFDAAELDALFDRDVEKQDAAPNPEAPTVSEKPTENIQNADEDIDYVDDDYDDDDDEDEDYDDDDGETGENKDLFAAAKRIALWNGIYDTAELKMLIASTLTALDRTNSPLKETAKALADLLDETGGKKLDAALSNGNGASELFYNARASISMCDLSGNELMRRIFDSIVALIADHPDATLEELRKLADDTAYNLGEAGGETLEERRNMLVADNVREVIHRFDALDAAVIRAHYVDTTKDRGVIDAVFVIDGTPEDNIRSFACEVINVFAAMAQRRRRSGEKFSLRVRSVIYGNLAHNGNAALVTTPFMYMPYGRHGMETELYNPSVRLAASENGGNGWEAVASAIRSDWRPVPENGDGRRLVVVMSKRAPVLPRAGVAIDEETFPSTPEEYEKLWTDTLGANLGAGRKYLWMFVPRSDEDGAGWNNMLDWYDTAYLLYGCENSYPCDIADQLFRWVYND